MIIQQDFCVYLYLIICTCIYFDWDNMLSRICTPQNRSIYTSKYMYIHIKWDFASKLYQFACGCSPHHHKSGKGGLHDNIIHLSCTPFFPDLWYVCEHQYKAVIDRVKDRVIKVWGVNFHFSSFPILIMKETSPFEDSLSCFHQSRCIVFLVIPYWPLHEYLINGQHNKAQSMQIP